ncbi:hypothetical protein ACQP2T_53975 [Nonomuraea sp. CA-143628]|uniref:hypothetical protein n=1 Tax=Nonomuraea sp. CA-143628 TaxID=3239997 RepID=UPI003D92BF14
MAEPDSADTLISVRDRASGHRRPLVLGAAAVAIALASAGGVSLLWPDPAPGSPYSPLPSYVAASALPGPLPSPNTTVTVPGTSLRLLEHPADPVRLVAYRIGDETQVRGPSGFTGLGIPGAEVAMSPDGNWWAVVVGTEIRFTDPAMREAFRVRLSGHLERPVWSPDGRRLLVTVRGTGFSSVDLATRSASAVVRVSGDTGQYSWLPGGSGVAAGAAGGGIRFRDLRGRELRVMNWVGRPYGGGAFSPSGDRFVTWCPSGGDVCVWDARDGTRLASLGDSTIYGWWDDTHLVMADPEGWEPGQVKVTDLQRLLPDRLLTEFGARGAVPVFTYARQR